MFNEAEATDHSQREMMHKMIRKTLVSLLVLGAVGRVVWDNIRLTVTRYSLAFADLPEEFDGFKIVQVSDLHNARFGKDQRKLIAAINSANPDMIAITGDLFHTARRENAYSFLEQAARLAPCYYVSGNHEQRFADYFTAIKPQLEALGACVLDDERATVTKGGASVSVIGLADPTFHNNMPPELLTEEKLSRLVPKSDVFTVLLSHRPELFHVYARNNISLTLTGHAHGGPLRIPFVNRGLYAVHQGWLPKYTEGIFVEDHTNMSSFCAKNARKETVTLPDDCSVMVVSRSLGNSTYYPKINDPPELVVVELRKK